MAQMLDTRGRLSEKVEQEHRAERRKFGAMDLFTLQFNNASTERQFNEFEASKCGVTRFSLTLQ